jgi:Na+/H+-dicarboxylate symporter
LSLSVRVLLALALGLVIGAFIESAGWADFEYFARLIEPLGTLWTNAIRMTVVPLVLALIITGVASATDSGVLARIGRKAIPAFLALLVAGSLLALALSGPLMSGLEIPFDVAQGLRETAAAERSQAPPPAMPSLAQRIIEIVPVNPVRAAADAAMLSLVVFALLFAVALTKLAPSQREPVVNFFRALGDAMLVLVGWVLQLAPIGVFALALGLGLRMGATAAGAILWYVAAFSAVLIAYIVLLYPVTAIVSGISLRRLINATAPALGIALSSRSSLAALPVVITGAREHLNAPAHVTGVALPLAVSVFRPSVPMGWVVGVLFLSKLYGVEISLVQMMEVIAVGTFLSFSVPGVPSASLLLVSPLLVSMGFPDASVGVLIAVDAIPDMFKTAANVASHSAVAALLTGRGGSEKEPPPSASARAKAA